MLPEPTDGVDPGAVPDVSVANTGTDTSATQQLEVRPAPTPTPDSKSPPGQSQQATAAPQPTLQVPLKPKPPAPSPQKTALLLLQKLLEEMKCNLANIQHRKHPGMQVLEEDDDEEDILMIKKKHHREAIAAEEEDEQEEKIQQEEVEALREMAEKYLHPNSVLGKALGADTTAQLKGLADDFLDRMQGQLDKEAGKEPKPQKEVDPDARDHRGEEMEGGMTQYDIVDAGEKLSSTLKKGEFQKDFQKDLGIDPSKPPEKGEESMSDSMEGLATEAEGLKTDHSSALKMTMGGGGAAGG